MAGRVCMRERERDTLCLCVGVYYKTLMMWASQLLIFFLPHFGQLYFSPRSPH